MMKDHIKLASKAPAPNMQNVTPANIPTRPAEQKRQSRDFNFGGGPVGPLFAGVALWLRRRKMKK